jgi:hypothetical protein
VEFVFKIQIHSGKIIQQNATFAGRDRSQTNQFKYALSKRQHDEDVWEN